MPPQAPPFLLFYRISRPFVFPPTPHLAQLLTTGFVSNSSGGGGRRWEACKSGLHRKMNQKKIKKNSRGKMRRQESNLAVSPSPPCFTSRSSFFFSPLISGTAAALITSLFEEKSISNPFKYFQINARVCLCVSRASAVFVVG